MKPVIAISPLPALQTKSGIKVSVLELNYTAQGDLEFVIGLVGGKYPTPVKWRADGTAFIADDHDDSKLVRSPQWDVEFTTAKGFARVRIGHLGDDGPFMEVTSPDVPRDTNAALPEFFVIARGGFGSKDPLAFYGTHHSWAQSSKGLLPNTAYAYLSAEAAAVQLQDALRFDQSAFIAGARLVLTPLDGEALARIEQEALRASGLAKLTDAEREALGLGDEQ